MSDVDLTAELSNSTGETYHIRVTISEGFFRDTMSIYINDQLIKRGKVSYLNAKGGQDFTVAGNNQFYVRWLYNVWLGGKPKSLLIGDDKGIIAQFGSDKAKRLTINNGFEVNIPSWIMLFVVACLSMTIYDLGKFLLGWAIGWGGIVLCVLLASDREHTTRMNFVICFLVTCLAWTIYFIV